MNQVYATTKYGTMLNTEYHASRKNSTTSTTTKARTTASTRRHRIDFRLPMEE